MRGIRRVRLARIVQAAVAGIAGLMLASCGSSDGGPAPTTTTKTVATSPALPSSSPSPAPLGGDQALWEAFDYRQFTTKLANVPGRGEVVAIGLKYEAPGGTYVATLVDGMTETVSFTLPTSEAPQTWCEGHHYPTPDTWVTVAHAVILEAAAMPDGSFTASPDTLRQSDVTINGITCHRMLGVPA